MGKIVKTDKTEISKQKTKTPLELALTVSDRIELESVRLMSCNCEQLQLVGPGPKNFEIEKKSTSGMDKGTKRVFVTIDFVLKTFETGADNKEPFVVIQASFLLIYNADTLEGITEEAVELFGSTNGIFNAWPYWREFVQNTTMRMTLPPLTIPVFRIFAPKEPEKPKKKVVSKKKTVQKV